MSALPEPRPQYDLADELQITGGSGQVDAVILHVAGAADHDTRHLLQTALGKAVAQAPAMLIVDLTALTFCDSAALNVLLQARTDAEAGGTWMVLVGAGPQPLHLLALTGTDRLFTIRPHMRAVRPPIPSARRR
ncbi:STAS domain-containing protein [Kitasatospora sp. NPDC051853]|uniref:STAS domain-containing protein n=1 Tax=Kitasatospora sp. NPDC051853 TaxID=3364058 RepID=UPI00379BEFE6